MIRQRVITIDCETLPAHTNAHLAEAIAAGSVSSLLTSSPSAPTKDDASANALPDARDDQRSALSGDTGRLLCIGFVDEGGERQPLKGVFGWSRERARFTDDEAEILRDFWEMMRTFRPCVDRIVGHNIYNFDLPFIYKRSVVRGVRPSIELNFARYRNQPIYDTMCEWEKWNLRHAISLDRLACVLGLESPKTDECDGSRVAGLFARGEHKTIRDYCLRDVITTRRIYRRMTFADSSPSKPTSSFEQPGGSNGTTSPLSIR